MYVCICHGFTDSQVRDLTAQGCRSLAQVYRSLSGEPPQCGKCVPYVRDMLRSGVAAKDSAPAACGGEIESLYGVAAE